MARRKKVPIKSSIDPHVALTLDMLGFDVPALIAELLGKIADTRTCPCCGREVRPLIRERKKLTDSVNENGQESF